MEQGEPLLSSDVFNVNDIAEIEGKYNHFLENQTATQRCSIN